MSSAQINPTRMELLRLREKLVTTRRGHKLLKDKQDELIHQFIPLLANYKALRSSVETSLKLLVSSYLKTAVKMDKKTINDQISANTTRYKLEAKSERLMGVLIPHLLTEEIESSASIYDLLLTTSTFDELIVQIKELFADLIALTSLESSINILIKEIEKSKRRVNAIENIVIKEMEEQISVIRMKLTDLERSNTIRMMKSKEIVLEKNSKSK